jgi:hypothetical protein
MRHNAFVLQKRLVVPMKRRIVSAISPMAAATSLTHAAAGASFTKAALVHGLQPTLQTMCPCLSIWVHKLTQAGCLA